MSVDGIHIFEANSDWDNITFIDLPQAQLFLKDPFGKDNKIQDMVHIKDWHWAAQVGVVAGMDAFAYFSGYYLQGNGSGPRKTVPGWIGAAVSSGGVAMACWGEDIANLISEAWDWLVN